MAMPPGPRERFDLMLGSDTESEVDAGSGASSPASARGAKTYLLTDGSEQEEVSEEYDINDEYDFDAEKVAQRLREGASVEELTREVEDSMADQLQTRLAAAAEDEPQEPASGGHTPRMTGDLSSRMTPPASTEAPLASPTAGLAGLAGALEGLGQASPARPRRRRLPTDYREEGGQTRILGPWKSTEVGSLSRRKSSAWELIQRLVGGAPADQVGMYRGQALQATAKYLAERSAADSAYLADLGAPPPARPELSSAAAPAAPEAVRRLAVLQRTAERSARLASELRAFLERHARAEGDIRRTVRLATEDAEASRGAEQEARAHVWPEAPPLLDDPLKGHLRGGEVPEGTCAWLAVTRYLAACQALQDAHSAAQSRLHRKELHLAQLQVLVDNVLGQAISASLDATPDSVPEIVLGDGDGAGHAEPSDHGPGEDEGDDDESPTAILSMEAAPLVMHQLAVDVCYQAADAAHEDSADEWISSHILVSVDLWLHVWGTTAETVSGPPLQSTPSQSIYLPRACAGPVAIGVSNQPRVLHLKLRKTSDTASPASTGVLGGVADWAKGAGRQDLIAFLTGGDPAGHEFPLILEFRGSPSAEILLKDGWTPCHAAAGMDHPGRRQYRAILQVLVQEQRRAAAARDAVGCTAQDWAAIARGGSRERPLSAGVGPAGPARARSLQRGQLHVYVASQRPQSATGREAAPASLVDLGWRDPPAPSCGHRVFGFGREVAAADA
ncbi:unnamed protein product [Prorocentrum cordatum]|uniref:Rab3 GTPase-activating protein catalytic subunit n=1 Tax=Prorocentrum cordatum TaxID=2364126 RepID=A0ABN9V9D8_9DINO|nr:unnamed protein product [Polarella glacialis]